MKKIESFESGVKALEITQLLSSKSLASSSYTIIDNVLVRVSNHYPVLSNLQSYNDLDSLDGILFVFVGENPDKFENQIENDSDFNRLNIDTFCIDINEDNADYILNRINSKIKNLK